MGSEPAAPHEADENLAEMLDSLSGADNYLDFLTSLIQPHLQGRVLEVGAGHGDLTERLATSHAVHATDISDRCLARLADMFADNDAVTVDYLDLSAPLPAAEQFSDRSFGSVVMVNVLEHLEDEQAVLERLHRLLVPGGSLIVFVPAFDVLYGRFDRLIGHQRRYRRDGLDKAFERAGFRTVDGRYVNLPGWFAWLVTVRLLGLLPTGGRLVKLYDRLVIPLVRSIESRVKPPFGQSVLGIARATEQGSR